MFFRIGSGAEQSQPGSETFTATFMISCLFLGLLALLHVLSSLTESIDQDLRLVLNEIKSFQIQFKNNSDTFLPCLPSFYPFQTSVPLISPFFQFRRGKCIHNLLLVQFLPYMPYFNLKEFVVEFGLRHKTWQLKENFIKQTKLLFLFDFLFGCPSASLSIYRCFMDSLRTTTSLSLFEDYYLAVPV